MKTIAKSLVNADSCRAALAKFWGDQLRIEPAKDGFFLALPLSHEASEITLEGKRLATSSLVGMILETLEM